MTGLHIKKYGYSIHPWRFELNGREFWIMGQPHFSFPRKRDAVPFLEKLLAVGDWTRDHEFTDEQRRQVVELAMQTESYREFRELMNRPMTTY
jgi:hypothetical protein